MTSALEETFYLLATAHGYEFDREVTLIPGRRFRADFANRDRMLAVEIEGGVWTNGRHTRGLGYSSDCRKYNLATLAGWRILRFTADMLSSGEAMEMVGRAWSDEI